MRQRAPHPVPLRQVVDRLAEAGLVREAPEEAVDLLGVSADSRTVVEGDLFCAWSGHASDAHDHVPAAVSAGAAAVVVERRVEAPVPQVVVEAGRLAAALAADTVMGSPAEGLVVAGVTGTNGKTTTVAILRHVLSARWRTASLGTVGARTADGQPMDGAASLTTPGPVEMATTLRAFVEAGTEAVAMEVSSHALDQSRVHAVRFDVAAFTNLSRDHLDYHGSFERYRATKREFVELLGDGGTAVVNADDPAWQGLERRAPGALLFAVEGGPGEGAAQVVARDVRYGAAGSRFRLDTPRGRTEVELPLLGAYNVQNALAAAASGLAVGLELEEVAHQLGTAPPVPGRLEQIADRPCRVLVDYAHTPDALERVLETLRPVVAGELIVVFGAGGDRDAGKRPAMGEVVGRRADVAIVTSDNPRTEDPDSIIEGILPGLEGAPARVERITDRRSAIERALERAGSDDLVLLAGKGHETYQVVGTESVAFDEREIVREWIESEGAAG